VWAEPATAAWLLNCRADAAVSGDTIIATVRPAAANMGALSLKVVGITARPLRSLVTSLWNKMYPFGDVAVNSPVR